MDGIDRFPSKVLAEGGRAGHIVAQVGAQTVRYLLVEDAGATTHEIGEGDATGSVTIGRDAAGVIIFVGSEMPDVLGWRPEELIGRPSTDFIHPEDQASAITAWFSDARCCR